MVNMVFGILEMAATGASHEIERDEELSEFSPEIVRQPDLETAILTTEDGRRFRVTVERID